MYTSNPLIALTASSFSCIARKVRKLDLAHSVFET